MASAQAVLSLALSNLQIKPRCLDAYSVPGGCTRPSPRAFGMLPAGHCVLCVGCCVVASHATGCVACCGTFAVHAALCPFMQILRAACNVMHPACCCCMLHLRVVSVAPAAHTPRASQRAACCALHAAVQNAWCVLRRAAPHCNPLQRAAPGCNGLHGCAVSVSVGHIRSVTVHVDWPTRSVAVEISGACYSRCRAPAPRIHGLTPTTSGPALGSNATSASGLRRPLPHPPRDLARPCSILIRRARVLQPRSHAHSRMMFLPHKRRHALWASTHSLPQQSGYSG